MVLFIDVFKAIGLGILMVILLAILVVVLCRWIGDAWRYRRNGVLYRRTFKDVVQYLDTFPANTYISLYGIQTYMVFGGNPGWTANKDSRLLARIIQDMHQHKMLIFNDNQEFRLRRRKKYAH